MCTSINYNNGDHYFGRNLDLQIEYPVNAVITPRKYPFKFKHLPTNDDHYALIGMAIVEDNYPLYFEAVNDVGLGMAGLNFPVMAHYHPVDESKTNLASFEIIPYILGTCKSVAEAKEALKNINITDDSFSEAIPDSPLHWQIGDNKETIVVESLSDGLHVYDNPFGVLTNCPTFDYMEMNLSNYINITGKIPTIRFAEDHKDFSIFSTAMGSYGLPGGFDSVSRFVRVAFTTLNSRCDQDEYKNVSEYFHLLGTVQQTPGVNQITGDLYEYTQYTCCSNVTKGLFYFNTYYDPNIRCVDFFKEDLDQSELKSFEVTHELKAKMLN